MLPSTLKYLYSVEPVRTNFPAKQLYTAVLRENAFWLVQRNRDTSTAYSIICTLLFRGKMHSDWFNGIEILQGRWQHGEKVGYCYPSGLEKTLCKWDIYVPLVTKGLMQQQSGKKCKWNRERRDYWGRNTWQIRTKVSEGEIHLQS
jgi:hypothetical protein